MLFQKPQLSPEMSVKRWNKLNLVRICFSKFNCWSMKCRPDHFCRKHGTSLWFGCPCRSHVKPCELWVFFFFFFFFSVGLLDSGSRLVVELSTSADSSDCFCFRFGEAILLVPLNCYKRIRSPLTHSSGAVWESRWPSWAVRPNEPSGFGGRKDLLNHASALVTACP